MTRVPVPKALHGVRTVAPTPFSIAQPDLAAL